MAEPESNEPSEQDRFQQVIQHCEASRSARRQRYQALRSWYIRGSGDETAARINQLRAHVKQLISYLYSPESTRFGVVLPSSQQTRWRKHTDIARDELKRHWRDSGLDVAFTAYLEQPA